MNSDVMGSVRKGVATLFSLIRFNAPVDMVSDSAGEVEGVLATIGPPSGRLYDLLLSIREGGYDRQLVLGNLHAIVLSGIKESDMFHKGGIPSVVGPSSAIWAGRVRDAYMAMLKTGTGYAYPSLLGCASLLHSSLIEEGLVSEAAGICPLVDACLVSPKAAMDWLNTNGARVVKKLIGTSHGGSAEGTSEANNRVEEVFGPLPPSDARLSMAPSIIVLVPSDYTEVEHAYVKRSLTTFLTSYANVVFVGSLSDIPSRTTKEFLVWPGRTALLGSLDPRSVRTFVTEEGDIDALAPRWMALDDASCVSPHPSVALPGIATSRHVPMVTRPISGVLHRRLTVAKLVSWTKEGFDFLVDRISADLTYDTEDRYHVPGKDSKERIRVVNGLMAPPSMDVAYNTRGRSLSPAKSKVDRPDVLVDAGDMTDDEIAYMKEALLLHLVGRGRLIEVRQGEALPADLSVDVVVWPPRTIPIRSINTANRYVMVEREGVVDRDPRSPQWVASKDAVVPFPARVPVPEGEQTWSSLEHIAEVNGLVFGRVARQLESVSLVRWGKGSIGHLLDWEAGRKTDSVDAGEV